MRVALAGATGFIGGAIARALRAARSHAAHRDAVDHELIAFDPRRDTLRRAGALVWAAGRRDDDAHAHVDAVQATVLGVRPRWIVYLSSGECYGDAPVPFREAGPVLGASAYARTKLAGERAVIEAAGAVGARAILLRLGVVYGPAQPPRMLIPQVARALRAGDPIALTTGEQTRDFVHVDDVARAVLAALARVPDLPGRIPGRIVNIGSGCETRVRDVCLALARLLDRDPALLRFGDRAPRPHEPVRYRLDIARADRELGFTPRIALAAGLREVCA